MKIDYLKNQCNHLKKASNLSEPPMQHFVKFQVGLVLGLLRLGFFHIYQKPCIYNQLPNGRRGIQLNATSTRIVSIIQLTLKNYTINLKECNFDHNDNHICFQRGIVYPCKYVYIDRQPCICFQPQKKLLTRVSLVTRSNLVF